MLKLKEKKYKSLVRHANALLVFFLEIRFFTDYRLLTDGLTNVHGNGISVNVHQSELCK